MPGGAGAPDPGPRADEALLGHQCSGGAGPRCRRRTRTGRSCRETRTCGCRPGRPRPGDQVVLRPDQAAEAAEHLPRARQVPGPLAEHLACAAPALPHDPQRAVDVHDPGGGRGGRADLVDLRPPSAYGTSSTDTTCSAALPPAMRSVPVDGAPTAGLPLRAGAPGGASPAPDPPPVRGSTSARPASTTATAAKARSGPSMTRPTAT